MPWYNQLLGYTLNVSWNALPIYLFLVGIIIVVGFLAGSYPAFFLSAFSPDTGTKRQIKIGQRRAHHSDRYWLWCSSAFVFLIVGTIIITKQMSYVKNKQLGYNKEQTLIIPIDNGDIYNNLNSFKTQLQNETAVQSVSAMSGEPGGFF